MRDLTTYVPLNNLYPNQATYTVCNSSLSEFAVLGRCAHSQVRRCRLLKGEPPGEHSMMRNLFTLDESGNYLHVYTLLLPFVLQDLNWVSVSPTPMLWCAGRPNLVTSTTMPSASLTSSSAAERTSGSGRVGWSCSCHTATRGW